MKRILVGGLGNVFLGDDGFGVEVAARLARRPQPEGVRVVDFGIRSLDLVYSLLEPHDAVVLVDLAARGGAPGTLYLMELEPVSDGTVTLEGHAMDPVKVLALAGAMGAPEVPAYLVGCEPARMVDPESGEMEMGLSPRLQAAVEGAVAMVEELLVRLGAGREAATLAR